MVKMWGRKVKGHDYVKLNLTIVLFFTINDSD
jgi:hypothetical protein